MIKPLQGFKKILIINPFGIGDVLFTTPLIAAIKETHPQSILGYWCNERVRDILKNNPKIDKVFALSRGDLKKIYLRSRWDAVRKLFSLLRQIRKERFEVTFDFSLDYRYSLLSQLLGIEKRVGFNYKKRGLFLTDRIKIDGYSAKHIVEHYFDLLRFFDIPPKIHNLEVYASEGDIIKMRIMCAQSGIKDNAALVGLAPAAGASWGKYAALKHWPAIKYAQLADKIIDNFGAVIVLLGNNPERPISEIIVSAMKNKVVDFTGKINIGELIALIKNLKILITNDGGPLHVAVAAGIKTVSIFGPVDDKVYGPYPASGRHIVVTQNTPCRPCYQRFRMNICDNHKECINSIEPERVFRAVKELW